MENGDKKRKEYNSSIDEINKMKEKIDTLIPIGERLNEEGIESPNDYEKKIELYSNLQEMVDLMREIKNKIKLCIGIGNEIQEKNEEEMEDIKNITKIRDDYIDRLEHFTDMKNQTIFFILNNFKEEILPKIEEQNEKIKESEEKLLIAEKKIEESEVKLTDTENQTLRNLTGFFFVFTLIASNITLIFKASDTLNIFYFISLIFIINSVIVFAVMTIFRTITSESKKYNRALWFAVIGIIIGILILGIGAYTSGYGAISERILDKRLNIKIEDVNKELDELDIKIKKLEDENSSLKEKLKKES